MTCSKVGEAIEEALQRMMCPYPLQAHQIQGLDYPAVLLVVQWLVKRVFQNREEASDQVNQSGVSGVQGVVFSCVSSHMNLLITFESPVGCGELSARS